ncbi:MAG TPA: class I SAM-dependent methyltransferase [Mycobacteriales bacterium]|nr:class I SAM-dependent methyltransferase [Mycobacteriales bacterium]
MNPEHLKLCSSAEWAEHLREDLIPWVLQSAELPGANVLEIGPGPGAATDVLRHRVSHVIGVEYDRTLAAAAHERFADDPRIRIVRGDAAALPFRTGRFEAVAAFTMLHHLPDPATQDRALAEFARVLQPGGVFFGTDSLDSPGLRRLHEGDVLVPLDPLTVGERLQRAGFTDVSVAVLAFGVRFSGRVPITAP